MHLNLKKNRTKKTTTLSHKQNKEGPDLSLVEIIHL